MATQLLALALVLLTAASAHAAPTARTLYAQASQREQAVRVALASPSPSAAVLKSVRTTIAWYEAVVRQYPTSAYCDDALWRAGRLALDAFDKFGEARERDTGLRLLRLLVSEYPTSRLVKQAPKLLARLDGRPMQDAAGPQRKVAAPARPAADAPRPAEPRPAESPRAAESPRPAEPRAAESSRAVDPAGANDPARAIPVAATAAPRPTTITDIRRAVLPDVVRVVIALDGEVPFHDERIAGPSRIFIDFPSTRASPALTDQTLRFDDDSDLVRQVRIGRHPNMTTRVVLDATGVTSYSVYPLYSPYRLVIDCLRPTKSVMRVAAVAAAPLPSRSVAVKPDGAVRGPRPTPIDRAPILLKPVAGRRIVTVAGTLPGAAPAATSALNAAYVRPLSGRAITIDWGRRLPPASPGGTLAIAQAFAPAAEPAPMAARSTVSAAPLPSFSPSPSSSSAPSMARQLGLGVSRIVIDPGHGGHDPGAKGKGGVTEAELVLDVSLRLQKLLENVRGVEVILTRQTDGFVPLQERTAIANREGADLFLSVHANASVNEQAHGVETYFLNFANNLAAASVAARENAGSGQAMGALQDFVKAIALNNKLDESRDFATLVQQSMVDRLRVTRKTVKNLGVKQAPFVVLIGASMPSVLTEISFVTNPQEAKLLKNNDYRQSIAEALFNAVRKYQTSLNRTQAIASQ